MSSQVPPLKKPSLRPFGERKTARKMRIADPDPEMCTSTGRQPSKSNHFPCSIGIGKEPPSRPHPSIKKTRPSIKRESPSLPAQETGAGSIRKASLFPTLLSYVLLFLVFCIVPGAPKDFNLIPRTLAGRGPSDAPLRLAAIRNTTDL